MLSDTVKNIVPSGTIEINSRVLEMKEQGINIINLSVGEPDFNTPDAAKEAAIKAMTENKTKYDKVAGVTELRKAICKKLESENNVLYSPEEIVVTNGTKQGITNTCFTLLNEGDEVIIPTPYWVSYPEIVKIARGVPVFAQTSRENDFKITGEDIANYATEKTKMVILCNPSNPLGTVHTREELSEIVEECSKRNIYILADEVYETICFDSSFVSCASISPRAREITVTLNGLSKSIPMTGWRVGYTAAPKELAKAMVALQGHLCSHPSTVSQWAGLEALQNCGQYTNMMTEAYRERMTMAVDFLRQEMPEVSFIEPKGAFYIFMDISFCESKLSHNGSVSMEFTKQLLEKKHVAVAPGWAFGQEGYIRLAYACHIDVLRQGLERIRDFVREL